MSKDTWRNGLGQLEIATAADKENMAMGYEVKPREVDVPEGAPFMNDRLDRRPTAEALRRFIGTIDGPCVVSLDAGWGMGKTTFLRMWREHLCLEGFSVVMFNAWDNDFANEPFLALSEELREALGRFAGVEPSAVETFATAARDVVVNAVPALSRIVINLVAGGVAGDVVEGAVDRVMALGEPDLSRYGAAQAAMCNFRTALATAASAQALAEAVRPPLVILIDELDRCRPSYAVELLEVLKHLFAVKGVVFVLAVNRQELEHSVRALYGAEFGAEVYLRRFFDVDLRLPNVNRDRFIDAQMEAIWQQLHDIAEIKVDGWRQHEVALDWARRFFGLPQLDRSTEHLDLRTVQQALQRLGLVLAMLEGDPSDAMRTAMLALILRTRDRKLYERFVNREVGDDEVGKAVFGWVDPAFRTSDGGVWLEVTLIMAAMEAPPEAGRGVDMNLSKLYRRHHRFLMDENFQASDLDANISGSICRSVVQAVNQFEAGRYPSYRETVRRMELVADDTLEVLA